MGSEKVQREIIQCIGKTLKKKYPNLKFIGLKFIPSFFKGLLRLVKFLYENKFSPLCQY